jgi:hypothetical protein
MERLYRLLLQNQSLLDKLRVRALYCVKAMATVKCDFHKQYGPYAGYWDDWVIQAEEMHYELHPRIILIDDFLQESREVYDRVSYYKRQTKSNKAHIDELVKLAEENILLQRDLLKLFDERINVHKELTEKLLLVEAIDGLSEE